MPRRSALASSTRVGVASGGGDTQRVPQTASNALAEGEAPHVCAAEALLSVARIRAECRACPSCHAPIFRELEKVMAAVEVAVKAVLTSDYDWVDVGDIDPNILKALLVEFGYNSYITNAAAVLRRLSGWDLGVALAVPLHHGAVEGTASFSASVCSSKDQGRLPWRRCVRTTTRRAAPFRLRRARGSARARWPQGSPPRAPPRV
eukprot:scaffold37117_cov19-Tisochrysis_lutea.AAC.2